MKPLFIADDFGLNASVDRAIVDLARARAIDGTSALVTGGNLDHLAVLRTLPKLHVGLHLSLTWGRPIADPKQLGGLVRDDGSFGSLARLTRMWLLRKVEPAALRLEIAAQIECLRAAAGRIDYIDGHQHVQLFPPVLAALEDVIGSMSGNPLRVRFGLMASGRIRHRLILNGLVGKRRLANTRTLPFSSTIMMVDYESYSEDSPPKLSTEVMLHVAHPDAPDASLDETTYPYAARVAQFTRRAKAAENGR